MASSSTTPNHYLILKLDSHAIKNDIRKAWLKLSREHHPDRNPTNPYADAAQKEASPASLSPSLDPPTHDPCKLNNQGLFVSRLTKPTIFSLTMQSVANTMPRTHLLGNVLEQRHERLPTSTETELERILVPTQELRDRGRAHPAPHARRRGVELRTSRQMPTPIGLKRREWRNGRKIGRARK